MSEIGVGKGHFSGPQEYRLRCVQAMGFYKLPTFDWILQKSIQLQMGFSLKKRDKKIGVGKGHFSGPQQYRLRCVQAMGIHKLPNFDWIIILQTNETLSHFLPEGAVRKIFTMKVNPVTVAV